MKWLMVGACAALGFGCSSPRRSGDLGLYSKIDQRDIEIRRLTETLEQQQRELETYRKRTTDGSDPSRPSSAADGPAVASPSGASTLPQDARPGECYARVLIPPTYKTVTEKVVVEEASEQVEILPAEYAWVDEQILVKPETERLEVVPAEYEEREEQVMIRPATLTLEHVPAEYEWTVEEIMVRPPQKVWKKGRGLIERVDNATGEIMCLVEVPAEFKTIRKRVLKSPATTREVEAPPEYMTITREVLVRPETTHRVKEPAEHKVVQVKKIIQPPRKRIIPVEPTYEMVTKTVVDEPGGIAWRRVLCETNIAPDLMSRIQQALARQGFDPGPVDGIMGPQTMAAIQAYQGVNDLAVGGLTLEMMESLGVAVPSTP
jgi:hypothetical protein